MQRSGAEIVLRDRDPYLDPLVVFQIYFGLHLPQIVHLIKLVSHSQRSNLLFLLQVDPEIALKRIKTTSNPDFHESLPRLHRADALYKSTIPTLIKQRYIGEYCVIDSGSQDIPECVSIALTNITAYLGNYRERNLLTQTRVPLRTTA